MVYQVLNENWTMKKSKDTEYLPGTVPGSVYYDLLQNGNMENPFWKDNEHKALALMEEDYEYVTSFIPEDTVLRSNHISLDFAGIDTIADIYLNEQLLGKANNMYRRWNYDVTDLLVEGENTLRVYFHSPLQYIKQEYERNKADGSEEAMVGFPHIRKAHCMFGWDWGARLPDAGIWKEVQLQGYSDGKIEDVYIRQFHEADQVHLFLEIEDILEHGIAAEYKIKVTDPKGDCVTVRDTREVVIETPMLWYPNGYGEQYLYQIEVFQYCNGTLSDTWCKKIGLRTMSVSTKEDEWGSEFTHKVNGISMFAMGADYIPEDHILKRVTRESTYELLKQCKDANFNAIRVWGGGYYPSDWFYDICDELGLVVWQDFMFACAVYDLTEEFEENITQEFVENIKRIRNHACLGLWCGNNEMEMFVDRGVWVRHPKQKADYIKMYEYIIPKLVKKYDPETFYWPASPSSGGSFDAPNDFNRGDVHYWDVWHGEVPFTEYRKYYFRYLSEFGFQSFPSLETIKTFTDDEKDFNAFSYVMEKHQRNNSANGKIMKYLQQMYLYPSSFDLLVYTSQLLQADAIRYGVEHFRRNRGRCMGALYWQLNDCWPVISWSSIDYQGRWKALHYAAKRFFAPMMISCEEEGMLTQNTNVNAEVLEIEKSIRLNVANETRRDEKVVVKWAYRKNDGSILHCQEKELLVPAFTSVWFEKEIWNEADMFSEYVSYELFLENQEEAVSSGTVIFSLPKYFHFMNPELSYEIQGDEILVSSKTFAKSVEIRNEKDDLLLSDNYFDLNGESRRIKILRGVPEGITLRSVYDIC